MRLPSGGEDFEINVSMNVYLIRPEQTRMRSGKVTLD
jgi:hypothetical protein